MQPLQSYPVFEADQVLSNGHLNNLLNYLEQQERLTRIKLIGRGVVCGLEINTSSTAIRINKGCGLTSQGYLVQLCDSNFTHFVTYNPPVLPNDLYFLTQCGDENRNNIPYYGAKDIFELIPDSDKETEEKKPLNTINLGDYVVVLFLEAEQINLKNCDTQDCNDKGSRMDFILRVLLVKKSLFDSGKTISFNSILLKRFNVPVADMKTAEDILNGFLAISDDSTLAKLSENLIRSWDKFAVPLGLPSENPLKSLNLIDIKKKISGNTAQRIFGQYFYDFVDDLLKAYVEFRAKAKEVFGECCPDEMDFPLHLTLGLANENTLLGKRNSQRHYFESSPILNGQDKNADEAILLLERLVAMVKGFIGNKLQSSEAIAITPNTLGYDFISYRAIPYYYDWKMVNPLWYFNRSYSGNQRFNLGYRAALQSDAPEPVKNPLLYDIERYNAFRIEGHIGKNYRTALTEIIRQKQRFNLSFDVLALNAIDLSTILNGKEIRCHVEDLESDYRVMITGIVCQLQQIMAYVGNLRPKRSIEPNRNLGDLTLKKDFYISKNIVDMKKTIKADISKNQAISISNGDIIKNLALRDVEPGEKLADFVALDISRFIVDQKVFFEYIIKQPDLLVIFLQQLAEIVKYLLSFDLDKFDEDAYNKLWTPYSKTVASLIKEATNSKNEEIKSYFSTSNNELLFKCANEKLFALKEEYLKRLEQYHAAINFNEYFKKHPGLEHKAGVPKGGTFILIYNGETERVLNLPDLTIPNLNFNFDVATRNTLANLTAKESTVKLTDSLKAAAITAVSKSESLAGISAAKRTEFEFASDLIKKLNLGNDAKKVLDALNIRDREIRDKATPITKGTVIADFYLPYLCCSECPPIAYVIPEEKEPENRGPVANAGPDQTIPFRDSANVTLDGSASKDEDGTITAFSWSQQSGVSAVINTPNQVKSTVQFQSPGQYVFALKITDDKGASAQDTVTITATAPENNLPIANAGQDQDITFVPGRPNTAPLDGSASTDGDGTITAFNWSQKSGPSTVIITPNDVQTSVQFQSPGEYVFVLKVTDDKGASAEDGVVINVVAPQNNPPTANAGPDQEITFVPTRPVTAILNGSASTDGDGTITGFSWSQQSGPSAVINTPDQVQTTLQFLSADQYVFVLKVVDDKGASGEDSVAINVIAPQNNPPVANAGEDQAIIVPNPNTAGTITLDGSNSTDPENGPLTFSWTFEGGTLTPNIIDPSQVRTEVTGLLVGDYKFGLKITDNGGNSSSDSVNVNVEARTGDDDAKTKSCGPLPDILKVFQAFDGTVSNDLFKRFIEIYSPYGQVKEFFTAMTVNAEESPEIQIEFFVNEFVNTGLLSQFMEWLEVLHNVIMEFKELRSLAFELYRILNLLAIYIVCIQKEDYDVAKIPMEKVFEFIESHATTWAKIRSSGAFDRLETQLILRIANDMGAAMVQTEENGEVSNKPKYLSRLKEIGSIL